MKKIINFVQILAAATLITAIACVLIGNANHASTDIIIREILWLTVFHAVTLLGIYALRYVKFLKPGPDKDKGEVLVAYIFTILFTAVFTIGFIASYELPDSMYVWWIEQPWFLIGIGAIASMVNYRYGIAFALTVATIAGWHASVFSTYFEMLGFSLLVPLAVLVLHFIFFMKWSELGKKKPGIEVLK